MIRKRIISFMILFVLVATVFLPSFSFAVGTQELAQSLFDFQYYAENNQDVKNVFGNNENLLRNHYMNFGIKEGRKASPVFDVKYYLEKNSDLQKAFGNNYEMAYNHFINFGAREGRQASKEFDVKYYLAQYSDLAKAFNNDYVQAIIHYVNFGRKEGRKGIGDEGLLATEMSFIFDSDLYYSLYGDLQKAIGNNYEKLKNHYMKFGLNEGRLGSYAYDPNYYLEKNPDIKKAFGTDYKKVYEHLISFGIKEGRVASRVFDVNYYLNNNDDLKKAFGKDYKKAYEHFISFGINEGRASSEEFKVQIYKKNYQDLATAYGNNWKFYYKHYLMFGKKEGRNASKDPTKLISANEVTPNDFGKLVNYTPANGDTDVKWKIFYADKENIYLISDDCIKTKNAPKKNGVSVEVEGNEYYSNFNNVTKQYTEIPNSLFINKWMKLWNENVLKSPPRCYVAYLLDTDIWNNSYGNENASAVIGGPTLELFAASWNSKGYSNKIEYICKDEMFYEYSGDAAKRTEGMGKTANSFTYIDLSKTKEGEDEPGLFDKLYFVENTYWLATPHYISWVNYADPCSSITSVFKGGLGNYFVTLSGGYSLRPVVCLKTDVKLVDNGSGIYDLQ